MAPLSAMQDGAIVHLNINPSPGLDKDENSQISCSGTFLDKEHGLIITSGLIFAPLLQNKASANKFLVEESSHYKQLNLFFSRHGEVLKRSEFSNRNQTRKSACNEDDLLDYIEVLCNIKVYVQRHQNAQKSCEKVGLHDGDHSKNLFSFTISGNTKYAKKLAASDSNEKPWSKKPVNILAIWRCPALSKILQDILMQSSSGWSLTENDAKNCTEVEEQTRNLLPFFVLLRLKPDSIVDDYINIPFKLHNQLNKTLGPFLFSALRNKGGNSSLEQVTKLLSKWALRLSKSYKSGELASYVKSGQSVLTDNLQNVFQRLKEFYDALPDRNLSTGDQLFTVATPFGSLSPAVFLNSISKGIVTNLAGDNQVLVMTDARCVPGCEGGGIYMETQTSNRQLCGIIIAPFCWRQNEWVGLTFAVNLRPLLASLFEALEPRPGGSDPEPGSRPCSNAVSEMADLMDNVGLLKVGSRWGSAVLVRVRGIGGEYKKLMITCCHVVRKSAGATVRVRFGHGGVGETTVEARQIYCTPAGRVYDLAILEVSPENCEQLPDGIDIAPNFATEGSSVLAVGHGLFDDHMHLPASVTSGIISKILNKDGKQVLIQSTCAVHPGASGGALVNEWTRQLCGIIVCNTKDAICSASYPHINLSIPSTIILPALKEYLRCGDPKVLDQLHDPDPVISCYWQLGYNQIGKLQSKL